MQMQLVGDLWNVWIMFDHVKRVDGQTTMASHVCNLAYCKMMTIAICDMQSKVTKAQHIVWTNLNETMLNKFPTPNFKGFMAYIAQANWNDIIIYSYEALFINKVDKNRTFLFH